MKHTSKKGAGTLAGMGAVCCFVAGTIALLMRLGQHEWMTVPWGSLQPWLDIAPVENVVAAGLRSIALLVAYWLAGSTVAYGAARIARVPRLIRATARVTLPSIRRAIDRAMTVTVTTAALTAPLAPAAVGEVPSQPEPVVYQLSEQGVPTPVNPPVVDRVVDSTVIRPPGIGDAGYTPQPAGEVIVEDDVMIAGAGITKPADVVVEAGGAGRDSAYIVVVGDNLWTISAAHLRSNYPGGDVDAGKVARYWRRVIEINTPNLQSGNPNLIYPGEQIVLPTPAPLGDT
jgi:hypothetical protein